MFALSSVTVHVTVVVPIGKVDGALFVTELMSQLSQVKGVPRLTPVALHVALALIVTFAGAVIVGLILSITVTVAFPNETLFEGSAAKTKTEFAPISLQSNEDGVMYKVTEQLSVDPLFICAVLTSTTPFESRATVMFCVFITGLVSSITVTIALPVDVLPALSVMVKTTGLAPRSEQSNTV